MHQSRGRSRRCALRVAARRRRVAQDRRLSPGHRGASVPRAARPAAGARSHAGARSVGHAAPRDPARPERSRARRGEIPERGGAPRDPGSRAPRRRRSRRSLRRRARIHARRQRDDGRLPRSGRRRAARDERARAHPRVARREAPSRRSREQDRRLESPRGGGSPGRRRRDPCARRARRHRRRVTASRAHRPGASARARDQEDVVLRAGLGHLQGGLRVDLARAVERGGGAGERGRSRRRQRRRSFAIHQGGAGRQAADASVPGHRTAEPRGSVARPPRSLDAVLLHPRAPARRRRLGGAPRVVRGCHRRTHRGTRARVPVAHPRASRRHPRRSAGDEREPGRR